MKPFHTPFTLQAGRPTVVGADQNAPVLQLPSDVLCELVTQWRKVKFLERPMGSFKKFKISASDRDISYCQSLSLISTTTVPLYVYVRPSPSISVTFQRFHTVTEGMVCG